MARQGVSFFDEVRQVPQLAELHDKMYVGGCFLAVDEGNYVWMVEALEDMDFGVEVLF